MKNKKPNPIPIRSHSHRLRVLTKKPDLWDAIYALRQEAGRVHLIGLAVYLVAAIVICVTIPSLPMIWKTWGWCGFAFGAFGEVAVGFGGAYLADYLFTLERTLRCQARHLVLDAFSNASNNPQQN